ASEHPLALAIVNAAVERKVDLAKAEDFDSPAGKGARARVDGKNIVIGNVDHLKAEGVDVSALADEADDLRRDGATAIFAVVDGKAAAVFAIADPVKKTTPEALKVLHESGIEIVMLTGDNRTTAEAVARKLGIDEVRAEILPADKSRTVEEFRAKGRIV